MGNLPETLGFYCEISGVPIFCSLNQSNETKARFCSCVSSSLMNDAAIFVGFGGVPHKNWMSETGNWDQLGQLQRVSLDG